MNLTDMLTRPPAAVSSDASGRRTKDAPDAEADQRFAEAVDAETRDQNPAPTSQEEQQAAPARAADGEEAPQAADAPETPKVAVEKEALATAEEALVGAGPEEPVKAEPETPRLAAVGNVATKEAPVAVPKASPDAATPDKATPSQPTLPDAPRVTAANAKQSPAQEQPDIRASAGKETPFQAQDAPRPQAQPAPQVAKADPDPGKVAATDGKGSNEAQPRIVQQAAKQAPQAPAVAATPTPAGTSETPLPTGQQPNTPVPVATNAARPQTRVAASEERARASDTPLQDAPTAKNSDPRPEPPALRASAEPIAPAGPKVRSGAKTGAIGQYMSDGVQAQTNAAATLRSGAPGQAAPLPAEFATPAAVERHIAPQIVSAAGTRASGGVVEIQLDPPELGRVEISIELSETTLRATISAERAATADLLRRHMDLLNQQFSEAGFDQIDLDFSAFAENEQSEADEGSEAGGQDPLDQNPDATKPTTSPRSVRYAGAGMDLRL